MDERHEGASGASRALGSLTAVVVALGLIFLALLGVANEIRFQGCLAGQDRFRANVIAVTEKAPALNYECSRVPLI